MGDLKTELTQLTQQVVCASLEKLNVFPPAASLHVGCSELMKELKVNGIVSLVHSASTIIAVCELA